MWVAVGRWRRMEVLVGRGGTAAGGTAARAGQQRGRGGAARERLRAGAPGANIDLIRVACSTSVRRPASVFPMYVGGAKINYFSKKLFSCLDLLGCLSFLKAFASICLILSLVTENCKPTSSKV